MSQTSRARALAPVAGFSHQQAITHLQALSIGPRAEKEYIALLGRGATVELISCDCGRTFFVAINTQGDRITPSEFDIHTGDDSRPGRGGRLTNRCPKCACEVPQPSAHRSVADLLAVLKVDTAFSLSVGRQPARGRSATLSAAQEQARHFAENPTYFARSGAVVTFVSETERDALLEAGAAGDGVQLLRSFRSEHAVTFSQRCSCGRLIWCGKEEHSGTCFCGNAYRVVFDLTPEDWSLPQGPCCMDCGARFGITETKDARSPWRTINAWQRRCDACVNQSAGHGAVKLERDERGHLFVRYSNEVRDSVLQRFVTENNLKADWPKAFVSSTGTINGHPIRFYRLPLLEG